MAVAGFETLREIHADARFRVTSARRVADGARVILKQVTPDAPASARLAERLRGEYALLQSLHSTRTARALGLVHADGGDLPVLVLADAGPETVRQWLRGKPASLEIFLELAIAMSEVLVEIHARGIVHGDVQPDNFIRAAPPGQLTLIDFETAAALAEVGSASTIAATIEGTLAYVAPEQTGRMSRPIDQRTDLYALGATFYELLTGAPPFSSADPAELVHAHLARAPLPPRQMNPAVPELISDLVLKLLAKMPERRYQSAEALLADLRQAAASWRESRAIAPFPLGRLDLARELPLPGRLYHRTAELGALEAALDAVIAGDRRVVVVSGAAGLGKTTLAERFAERVRARGGRFLAGAFEQRAGNSPYAPLVAALREGLRALPASAREPWRHRLDEALGAHAAVLAELVPEVGELLGPKPPSAPLGALEGTNRLHLAFTALVRALASAEAPLVLFVDDLQWADPASRALLAALGAAPELAHVLLLIAHRPDECDPLAELAGKNVELVRLSLAPLDLEDLIALGCDVLRSDPTRVRPLAELVRRKTAGNPFFVERLLRHLHREELLRFDPASSAWTWDLARIEALEVSDNVVELLLAGLRRLPAATQAALGIAACVGRRFELAPVAAVDAQRRGWVRPDPGATLRALFVAVEEGHLLAFGEAGDVASFGFAHDRIQQAAYSLDPPPARVAVHLALARALLAAAPEPRGDEIFAIADQLALGAGAIERADERRRAATVALAAGRCARAAVAFAPALSYLRQGLALVGDDWAEARDLVYALHRDAIECAYLEDETRAEALFAVAMAHAASDLERADLLVIQLLAHGRKNSYREALRIGFEALRLLGLEEPSDPAAATGAELAAIPHNLGGRPIHALIDAPAATGRAHLMAMEILSHTLVSGYSVRPEIYPFIVAKLVNLSLTHGNAPTSPLAYVTYGILLERMTGDLAGATAWAQLGVELARRRGDPWQKGRAFSSYAALLMSATEPIRDGLPLLRAAFAHAREGGDLLFAGYAKQVLVAHLFHHGTELAQLLPELDVAVRDAYHENLGQLNQLLFIRRAVRRLQGLGADAVRLEEEALRVPPARDEFPRLVEDLCELEAAFFLRDLPEATRRLARAESNRAVQWTSLHGVDLDFYAALVHAANGSVAAIAPYLAALARRAEGCPANFRHKQLLVAAELARLEGRPLEAAALYDQAIDDAGKQGFVHLEALAQELAGRFFLTLGRTRIATLYLGAAADSYARWGARGKLRALEEELPHETGARAGTGTRRSSQGTTVAALELASLLRAAETIASEVVGARFFEKLIEVCLSTAGAERGALLLANERGRLLVRALGAVDAPARVAQVPLGEVREIPGVLIEEACRAGDVLVLGDAANNPRFASEPGIGARALRSVLVVPIRREERLVGVLYLENNLATHVFTADRVRVLQLLAAQIAISVDNARLYEEAKRAVRLRDDFLVTASHELNTPVASLLLMSEGLESGTLGEVPEALARPVQLVLRQTRKLKSLIQDLMQVASFERGPVELTRSRVELGALAADLGQALGEDLSRARCKLELRAPAPVVGRWDRALLERVVLHLLGNAIRFGGGKPITVTVSANGARARLSVADQGIGIASDRLAHIFDRFERAVPTSHYGGLGLGLHIVKQIVTAHEGTVAIESELARGTTARVELPLGT